jgi:hypothetical protein
MDTGALFGGSMPPWLLYPATALAVVVLLIPLFRSGSIAARFALFALCFRYIANAHHAITFKASPLGLSWNALGSSAVFLLGLLLIRTRHLLLRQMIPIYVFIVVIVLSGVANNDPRSVIDVVVKFGYLGVIMLAVYEGANKLGESRMMVLLLWAFILPFVLQMFSVIFGIVKASESDGSISYIGGYNHEAAFSIVLMTCFMVACFATGLRPVLRMALLVACLVAIFLANYRTAILALAPLAFVQFNMDIIHRFSHRQRLIIGVFLLILSVPAAVGLAWLMRERFADIAVVISSIDNLIKPPDEYTFDEARLISGRAYLWSEYITAYLAGDTLHRLFGFGPDAWIGKFPAYAHNTLVSTLYEYGLIGVLAMLYLWGAMLSIACRIRNGPRSQVIAAHIGFFILNMATMPHWMLEGDILYGVICGYTLYLYLRVAPVPVPRRRPAQPAPSSLGGPDPVPPLARHQPNAPSHHGAHVRSPADIRGMVAPGSGGRKP